MGVNRLARAGVSGVGSVNVKSPHISALLVSGLV